jgi:transposase
MMDAILAGNLDAESISDLAVGKLKGKKEKLKKALMGNFQEHHRFMIQASLNHIESLEKAICPPGRV